MISDRILRIIMIKVRHMILIIKISSKNKISAYLQIYQFCPTYLLTHNIIIYLFKVMKILLALAALLIGSQAVKVQHREECKVYNQWGGNQAPWNEAGSWIIGYRPTQKVQSVNIVSTDGGNNFTGQMVYAGEGPIGFKANRITGNSFNTFNQWGGSSAPWNNGGYWAIGDRDGQRIIKLDVQRQGNDLVGTAQYVKEGPIGFKATCQ